MTDTHIYFVPKRFKAIRDIVFVGADIIRPYFIFRYCCKLKKSVFLLEVDEFLICSLSVKAALWKYLDYAVCCGLHYFVVVRCKENNSLEIDKAVVDSCDAFKVKVVRRTVKHKYI